MASNGMNGTKAFQDTIAQYLMKRAENDPLVAVKLANPSKTMEQCCAYIIGDDPMPINKRAEAFALQHEKS